MPDWHAIVASHLAGLNLSPARRQQILQELSEHLEDEFAALCEWLPEEEAQRQALSLLTGSDVLVREIRNAEKEDPMNWMRRTLWLPGLTTAALYTLLLVTFARLGHLVVDIRFVFYGALALLVMIGAVGSWWARAMGATPLQRALVSLSPIFCALVASFLIALPVHAFKTGRPLFSPLEGEVFSMLRSVSIQTGALLLGALPFLKGSPRDSQPSS